jgi:hypothetical protein
MSLVSVSPYYLPASFNPIRVARIQRTVHRRGGRDSLIGAVRDCTHCAVGEATRLTSRPAEDDGGGGAGDCVKHIRLWRAAEEAAAATSYPEDLAFAEEVIE